LGAARYAMKEALALPGSDENGLRFAATLDLHLHDFAAADEKWPDKMIQTVRGIGYMLDSAERPAEKAV